MATIEESNSLDTYKLYISSIMNRLIKEKHILVEQSKVNNQMRFTIKISNVEWYLELDDDTKYNVEMNLQEHYKPLILQALEEYNNRNKNLNGILDTNSKRQKTND
jgi:hypothetical protein